MKVSEKSIQPGVLKSIRELAGGRNGDVFLLENAAGEKLIVKFQSEGPVSALAGTYILKQAGALAPEVREASRLEVRTLAVHVTLLKHDCEFACEAFAEAKEQYEQTLDKEAETRAKANANANANAKGAAPRRRMPVCKPRSFKHVLLMEYVEGSTLEALRKAEPIDQFLVVIRDRTFQAELGKILAADAFAGNQDRMYAALLHDQSLHGWINAGNTVVRQDRKPVAIDNAFQPSVSAPPATLPWGRSYQGSGTLGSIAAAYNSFAYKEAALLFDTFMSHAKASHPGQTRYVSTFVMTWRPVFIKVVGDSAYATMRKLLGQGLHWKKSLAELGGGHLLEQFRIRKRLLRQVTAGADPQTSLVRAKDDMRYRRWVLTTQLNVSEAQAERLLQDGFKEYKQLKQRLRGQ